METGYDIIFFGSPGSMISAWSRPAASRSRRDLALGADPRPVPARRCSKTKGNVVDPLAVMAESGADALRFALIHGATPGQDQRFGPRS